MEERPDLIVAIDYGMTCTGVAYANLTRGENIYYIQKWPGRPAANENKVPTVIVYDKRCPQVSSWGFISENQNRADPNNRAYRANHEYCDWFKTFLDPKVLAQAQAKDPENSPNSQADVDRWTEDYMHLLYQHIEFKLSSELPSHRPWSAASVEFIFSVPTTWPMTTVEKFKSIASRAGFASYPKHILNIGLTEAEAAAVHVSVEAHVMFQENQVLLICDAGGGTTDLSVMRVSGINRSVPALKALDVVNGKNIGSAQIDEAFEDLVLSRLERANQLRPLRIDVEDAAWMMMKSSQWQDAKCCYGSPDDVNFAVTITGLDPAYSNEEFNIADGRMRFTLADLQALFDTQITKLFDLIDEQLARFDQKFPADQIAHLVLSGGLGNSAYVQRKMKQRYAMSVNTSLQVHVAPEPQLAVCKGIAANRVRTLKNDPVLKFLCCRNSYGTICKILYDKNNPEHFGKPTYRDPLNGKSYITQAIAWFVKKGEPISVDTPLTHKFSRKLTPGDPRRAFPESIVVSHLEMSRLPLRVNDDAKVLCDVKSDLSMADEKKFKRKNRHWWQFHKQEYLRVDYEVRVVVGAATLSFELWFDGQRLKMGDPITVEWQESVGPAGRIGVNEHGVLNR